MIPKERLFDFYDKCLGSIDAPFQVMGEELVNLTGVEAASLWMENPHAPGALIRLVFFSRLKFEELAQEDHKKAMQVHETQRELHSKVRLSKGSTLSCWGSPIPDGRSQLTLMFWSTKSFSQEELRCFSEVLSVVRKLVDVILSSDLFSGQRMTRELQMAQLLQKQLMPKIKRLEADSSLAFRTLPVYELGGDYVDVLTFPNGLIGLTVADAMGSGVPAAFVMLMARTIFRLMVKSTLAPSQVLFDLNNYFMSEISHFNTFVTQFYGMFEPSTRRFLYTSAGHVQPLLFRREAQEVAALPSTGIALGVKADAEYPSAATQLEVGDILVIFSDGLSEARNERNEQFGIDGIAQTLLRYKEYDADGICDGLIHSVLRHSKVQHDDISLIVIKP